MKRLPESLVNFSLALASAALLVLTFPNILGDTGYPWLAPVALTPLLIALAREPRPLWRFLLGEIAGIVYWFAICYWIQFVLEVHGGMGRWGGWGTFALFCVAKAIHLAVFSLFAGVLIDAPFGIPAIAALWTGIERTHPHFGFAWLTLGNAGIDMPLLLRVAPWVGVYGLSFLFALIAAVVAAIILKHNRRLLYWLAAVPASLLLFPDLPTAQTGDQTALLLQPKAPEDEDYTAETATLFKQRLINQTIEADRGSPVQLILWPEVPGPIYYYADPAFRDQATNLARLSHAYFLFGTVAETKTGAPLNSAIMLKPDGEFVDRYDKINLVPFGEFIPPLFGWVNRITHEAGDFVPGDRIVVFPMGQHAAGAFICYEAVFPHQVREFAKQGAQVLVNLSNDGYFGHSAAREQHLQIVRMRAVENRRWILRATNDGISAVIDSAGRVQQRLPLYQATTARAAYRYEEEKTFYTDYGDWFAWACLLAAAIVLFRSQWPHYTPPVAGATRAGSPAHRRP